ncbi:MAG: NAD(P)/FAD-dependent oxidoreductase [Candidatus Helarchaeota archaeon]|nr:NAD(P)/FAD-dependent oxidoreductase [Candidatus Helarchaeota archaeon]
MKKINIVGSGVGGSGVGALLANAGFDVELFEKNSLPGGRFCTYEKEGFNVDVGCHIIGNCEKGTLGEILDRIGMPIQWAHVRKPGPIIHFNGEYIHFPRDLPKLNLPKQEVKGLLNMFSEVIQTPEDKIEEYDDIDVHSFVSKYSTDPRVRSLFALSLGVMFVAPDFLASMGEWIFAQRELQEKRSLGLPIGGCISVPKTYCKGIEKNGGKIHYNTRVKRIVVEDNKATGIELEDGTFVASDIVISNAGIKPTVNDLVGKKFFTPEYLKLVDSYQYSFATLMVKVALKRKITDQKFICYVSGENLEEFAMDVFEKGIPEKHVMAMVPIISNLDPSTAPEGKQLLIAGAGAPTGPEQGDCNYEKWAEAILNSLRDIWPNIDDDILWVDVTTPADINKYAGKDGVVVGISQIVGQVGKNRPKQELPIENLCCCGADTGGRHIGVEIAGESALRLFDKLKDQKK